MPSPWPWRANWLPYRNRSWSTWPTRPWCCHLSLPIHRISVTLQGAGVLASWFGSLADDSGVRYFTQLGELPTGNAILLLLGSERMEGIAVAPAHASVSLEANPRDRFGKVLVVYGETSDDLFAIVQELASGQLKTGGQLGATKPTGFAGNANRQ